GVQSDSNIYHPSTNTWDLNVASTVFPQDRQGGTSILLPLRPSNSYGAKIMIMGGSLNHAPATDTAEIIDLSVATPAWRMVAPMSAPRQRMESCMLPNGLVLAAGGSINDEDNATAILAGDLFDPTTETWAPGGTFVYPHLYHSTLLLRPDGRVVIAGSNPVIGTWEPHIEVYSPPYLFTTDQNGNSIPAVRPTITGTTTEIGYNGSVTIQTPDSADIKTVVLTRLCSSTHNIDFDQRLVELNFSQLGTGKLKATAPPDANIAPPGYYLLWVLNNAGTPSEGSFVHLTANPSNRPPKGKITSPREDTSIQVGEAVNFTGTATDGDGSVTGYHWVFPGATPVNSNMQNPGLITFNTAGTHVVSMTAIDNLGVNDPSPPTRTITIDVGITYEKPADGSTYNIGAKVPIIVDAAGTTGDENTFSVSVDGTEVGSTTGDVETASFTWFSRRYAAGPHTITTTVTDETNATGSKSITVNLQ
ncbi:MAG TPA: galactose oxidase-like domain-containing protein, partial [Chthoniobacterales bacterium]